MPTQKNRSARHIAGNPVARAPLLKKGGVHGPNKTGQRQKKKQETKRLVADATSRFFMLYWLLVKTR